MFHLIRPQTKLQFYFSFGFSFRPIQCSDSWPHVYSLNAIKIQLNPKNSPVTVVMSDWPLRPIYTAGQNVSTCLRFRGVKADRLMGGVDLFSIRSPCDLRRRSKTLRHWPGTRKACNASTSLIEFRRIISLRVCAAGDFRQLAHPLDRVYTLTDI